MELFFCNFCSVANDAVVPTLHCMVKGGGGERMQAPYLLELWGALTMAAHIPIFLAVTT